MDSVQVKEEAGEVFVIDKKIEEKVDLARVRPLKLEPVDDYKDSTAEPQPSTSRAVAEVRLNAPPPPWI